jgi:hypothetical protein
MGKWPRRIPLSSTDGEGLPPFSLPETFWTKWAQIGSDEQSRDRLLETTHAYILRAEAEEQAPLIGDAERGLNTLMGSASKFWQALAEWQPDENGVYLERLLDRALKRSGQLIVCDPPPAAPCSHGLLAHIFDEPRRERPLSLTVFRELMQDFIVAGKYAQSNLSSVRDGKFFAPSEAHCCPVDGGYDFSIALQDKGF